MNKVHSTLIRNNNLGSLYLAHFDGGKNTVILLGDILLDKNRYECYKYKYMFVYCMLKGVVELVLIYIFHSLANKI